MGINVNGTIALTFAIGSALAAIAGVLLCSAYPSLTPYTGSMPGIKAFVAAVFGGIGSIPGAFIGGILLGVIEILSKAYIWVFRGTPLMLQLFFVYYGLPIMFGPAFRMENTVAAVLTFTMNYAAYFAEIYRAGVQSIDHGQHEAAKTLGFSRWQTMRIIIILRPSPV